jgi:hypothetical protein
MSTWKDRWRPQPSAPLKAAAAAPTSAKKKAKPSPRSKSWQEDGQRVHHFPDDDLRELEADARASWIDPRRVKDWLRQ